MAEPRIDVQMDGEVVDDFISHKRALALAEKLIADGHDEDDISFFISVCDNQELTVAEFRQEYGR